MATYVDRAYLIIDGENYECDSIKVAINDKTKPVQTMNRENRAKGYSRGVIEYTLSVEVPLDLDSEIDFYAMLEDGEEFGVNVEYEGGSTHSYMQCRLSKIDIDSKEGDATKYSLDIHALDRVET